MRTQAQQIWDYIAIIKLLDDVNKINYIDGNLKIQKLIFLSELEGLKTHIAPMHFKFFRYNLGPYSKELANSVNFLINQGFITSTKKITKRGEFLIEYVRDAINESIIFKKAFEIINETIEKYGRYPGSKLTNMVYDLKVPVYDYGGKVEKVRNIGTFTDIIVPTQMAELQDIALFDDILEDIEEELNLSPYSLDPNNPDYQKTITRALARVKIALVSA